MNIILENQTVPETGPTNIEVRVSFEIKVTAQDAHRQVNRWLFEEVSYMIGANPATLVIGRRPVWRVPAWIGFSTAGPFTIGHVDVDVETGELIDLPGSKARIEEYLEKEVKPRLPAYTPRTETPAQHLAEDVPPAPRL